MIPANVHPLIFAGGADPLDELGVISKALRLRASATASLTRVFGTPTNNKIWTWSGWLKKSRTGLNEHIVNGSTTQTGGFGFADSSFSPAPVDSIVLGFNGLNCYYTAMQFRDPAANYHIVLAVDTTQAVEANRFKLWVNGILQTLSVINSIAQNASLNFNVAGATHTIGFLGYAGVRYFDGYHSEINFVDGQQLTAASFGKQHPLTKQWRPIKYTGTYGNNGFRLDFSDASSAANLCLDRSGNGNNWTPANISVTAGATYDSVSDTPTNNYPTLNALIPSSQYAAVLSSGGLSATLTATSQTVAIANRPLPNYGEWFWEVECVNPATYGIAVGVSSSPGAGNSWTTNSGDRVYYNVDGKAYTGASGVAYGSVWWGASRTDVIGCKYNGVTGQLTFYLNGVSQGVAFTLDPTVAWYPVGIHGSGSGSTSQNWNFGQRAFAYPANQGTAKPLCTKNTSMPTNGIVIRPTSAFVTATDTGANIVATLAAAASAIGSNWIKIYKLRNANEGFRWQFSDDSGYYLDTTSTAAKAAFPTLSGTSYVGYALKVSAANGVATGRLTHVNGVADTVTDGLGNTRKAIILKNEATGSWYFYHPDLTAGKLLYIETNGAETTDATISTVLSNSFVVAAALASGTYRWIALAEVDGFLKLGKYAGNSSSDGPMENCGFTSALNLSKNKDLAGTGWPLFDNGRNTYNPVNNTFLINNVAGNNGVDSLAVDFVSNGTKIRTGSPTANYGDLNYSGYTHVFLSIAAFPFRYANAQ